MNFNKLYYAYHGQAPIRFIGADDRLNIDVTLTTADANFDLTLASLLAINCNLSLVNTNYQFTTDNNLPDVINSSINCFINSLNQISLNINQHVHSHKLSNLLLNSFFNRGLITAKNICNITNASSLINQRTNSIQNNSQIINQQLASFIQKITTLASLTCDLSINSYITNFNLDSLVSPTISLNNVIQSNVYSTITNFTDFSANTASSLINELRRCFLYQGKHHAIENYRENIPIVLPPPIRECNKTIITTLKINKTFSIANKLITFSCKNYQLIPTREVYHVQNELSLVRIADNLTIPCLSLKVPIDSDSWSGQFSASLPTTAALELIKTTNPLEPIIVESRINGYAWRWIAEDWSFNRSFNSNSITITGRGIVSLLSERYNALATYTENDNYSIAQLATNALIDGWTLNWLAADWSVPGGNFAYQNLAPINVIARLADASGAVIIPHNTNQTITIKPKYSVYPWEYYDETPDVIIPADAMLLQTRAFKGKVESNGVYVYGVYKNGITGFVKITGTDGSSLVSNTQGNALITHVDGARALGGRLLADNYQSPEITSFTIPLGGDYPLLELTQLVSITENTEDIRGCISSITINASLTSVTQDVTLDNHTNNNWVKFKTLLPKDQLLIATVLSRDETNKTSIVSPIGGGIYQVRGSGFTVGTKVYIKNGMIEGEAPVFTIYEIEV